MGHGVATVSPRMVARYLWLILIGQPPAVHCGLRAVEVFGFVKYRRRTTRINTSCEPSGADFLRGASLTLRSVAGQ